jgi:hypothetical protein
MSTTVCWHRCVYRVGSVRVCGGGGGRGGKPKVQATHKGKQCT